MAVTNQMMNRQLHHNENMRKYIEIAGDIGDIMDTFAKELDKQDEVLD